MTYARRLDANQAEIIEAFKKLGCSVLDMSSLGRGAPDLAIGFGGLTALVEVKDGEKPPSAQKLTPSQEAFRDTWMGGIRLVNSLEAVEETVKLLRRWHQTLSLIKPSTEWGNYSGAGEGWDGQVR